jgi:hypothetical protein
MKHLMKKNCLLCAVQLAVDCLSAGACHRSAGLTFPNQRFVLSSQKINRRYGSAKRCNLWRVHRIIGRCE